MTAYHRLTDDHFAALATGLGGPAAIGELGGVQHSRHLLLLRFLTEAWADDRARGAAVDVLVRAQRRDPGAIAALLTDPMVGVWAVRTARRVSSHEPAASASADLAQLGALAAAAAIRTGLQAEVPTWTLSGAVTLPTVGTAALGADGPAVVTTAHSGAAVRGDRASVTLCGDDERWLPLRRLVARDGDLAGALAVEDGNPYRDTYHAPAADRLSADEVTVWQDRFTEAWRLLARFVPERAAELAAGLRSVVPLVTEDDGVARSATARDGFGTLGLTRPRSASELAVTLVHEFQHSKLSVLLGLVPLYEPDGVERHFAPWRVDPRPTGGLIQGVYAFLGVADTWRGLRRAPGLAALADEEFAFAREQVHVGLSNLEESAELTPKGREFAAALRRTVDRMRAEHVPKPARAEASRRLAGRRDAWHRHKARSASVVP